MENEFKNSVSENEEVKIKKKKLPFAMVIIVIFLIVAAVVCCFSFFSEAAIRAREIKAHIASAEKYLDELYYENAIAEYEAALKLNPQDENIIDSYIDTVIAYAEDLSETNIEQAIELLEKSSDFLNELCDENDKLKEKVDLLRALADDYRVTLSEKESKNDDIDDAEESENTVEESYYEDWTNRDDILPYEKDGYIVFGAYEQDGDLTNGAEPIEWVVLGENENGLLLVSRYILDSQPYNSKYEEVTWETSSIRTWLNDYFYNSSFTQIEQQVITSINVTNSDNSFYSTDAGANTVDNIFLLSVEEIRAYYNFNTWDEESNIGYCQNLIVENTMYSLDSGAYSREITSVDYYELYVPKGYSEDVIGNNYGWCWLRTPGQDNYYACTVYSDGGAGLYCNAKINSEEGGIRPALYLKSGVISFEFDDVDSSKEDSDVDVDIDVDVDESVSQNDEILDNNDNGIENESVVDTDIYSASVGEIVSFGKYEQDNNSTNGAEPIEWIVLSKDDDGILLITRYALDNIRFNDEYTSAYWQDCTLRQWLNNTFYYSAFSADEQGKIITSTNSNPKIKGSAQDKEDTQEKVFLLNCDEIYAYVNTESLWGCFPTEYAVANGVVTGNSGYCKWWLRTPGRLAYYAMYVGSDGVMNDNDVYYRPSIGVRPAIRVSY